MTERNVIRRLRAFEAGKPLPAGETLPLHVATPGDALIVAFVRMGGESRPWGIAVGTETSGPTVLAVADGRNQDLVGDIAVAFADLLLTHLRAPGYVKPAPGSADDLTPLHQVWLPNDSHLEMLHHLAFSYTFTKYERDDRDVLNALGRACGWLFRESQRPGQQMTMVATQALRSAYSFPAEDMRQGHLGFLMAWLGTRGGRDKRLAAAMEAERRAMSTSLDPEVERSDLQPLVEAWQEATRAGSAKKAATTSKKIATVLDGELRHRWQITADALTALRADKRRVNAGVAQLVTGSAKEQWSQYTQTEIRLGDPTLRTYIPSPETDRNAAAAGARYLTQEASAGLAESVLIHDDHELLGEAVASGDVIHGEIIAVADEGTGRTTRPVWMIRDDHDRLVRLRTGSKVEVVGFAKRTGTIREFSNDPSGALLVEVEIEGNKTCKPDAPGIHAIAPNDPSLIGATVALIKSSPVFLAGLKRNAIWNQHGPGAWLTHARAGGVLSQPAPDDTSGSVPPTAEAV